MFVVGWGTAALVHSNIFAYLCANLLVVLLAKLAEMWLGPSGYFAIVAQLTWQVLCRYAILFDAGSIF